MEISVWHLVPPCLAGITLTAWLVEHVQRRRAEHAGLVLRRAQDNTLRLLRLSTGDQRNMALALIGHATAVEPADPALNGLARRLLDLSETLIEHTELVESPRFIVDERLLLMPVVEFAVAQVNAHLGPSRRAWRIDPAFGQIHLCADRRALNQVMVSVLTGAAATTRDGDWIELSIETGPGGATIIVQDEGIGLPVAQDCLHPEESRGIGLRLTLARSLVQAHGGRLTVESAECVGTRVRLHFPPARLADGKPIHCVKAATQAGLT